MAKKSVENGEENPNIPESMRIYLANQAAERGEYPMMSRGFTGYGPAGNYAMLDQNPAGKVLIQHFNCRSLSIGTWRRVAQKNMDLVIFYSPQKSVMTYYINNDQSGYKIEFPFSAIQSIDLETVPGEEMNDGRLVVRITDVPKFYMDSSGSGGFVELGDFSENSQASQVFTHYLGGSAKLLLPQLTKLKTCEAFVNRHLMPTMMNVPMSMGPQMHVPQAINVPQMNIFDQSSFMSAPVTPHIVRPASCSNDTMSAPTFKLQPPESFHRHKRTRSRSVPVAIDFSQMPLSSFSFGANSTGTNSLSHLYAPAPQHALGNALRIDTSNTGFLDYRNYPLSATTASPSEYASPPLMTASLQTGDLATDFGDFTNTSWVSPSMDAASLGPSVSPLSMGHSDPVMPGESPQMTAIRSASADLFPGMGDEFGTDPETMTEMYSKQTLDSLNLEDEDLDIHNMIQY